MMNAATSSLEARYPHVASPIRLNGCELRNRIVRTAHGTGYGRDGVTERLIAFHEARARGGIALTILETASVHPSSDTGAGAIANGTGRSSDLPAFRDSTIAGWTQLAERVHPHGMKVFQQLWHGGALATPLDGGRSWAPSEVPEPHAARVPQAMSKVMIDTIVEAFALAARRCKSAGLDGVEVHGAHGYLVGQFLSPLTNRRSDDYGGSLNNRTRFAREVLAAIRSEVGADFAVGIRLSATEGVIGGIEPPEAAETARRLEAEGLVDFVDVSMGSHYARPLMLAGMDAPHGYELPTSAVVTEAVTVPTIVAGRITSLSEAESVIGRGVADLVSMVRATIADPELVSKSLAGHEAQVRPCLGINQGCGERSRTGIMACTVNVHAGNEQEERPLDRVGKARRVLVAGAGPSGMEAARVAALRGHEVVVHERSESAGGLLRFSRRAPYRKEIGSICDWQVTELSRLGVKIHYGSHVDLAMVQREVPDVVIVATGSLPRRDGLQRLRPALRVIGVDLPHVVTPLEVLGAPEGVAAKRAVVLDDLGAFPALGTAEYLLERGAQVVLATGDHAMGTAAGSVRDVISGRLAAHAGFTLQTRVVLEEITRDVVRFRHLDSRRVIEMEADLVVLMTGFQPQSSLHEQLTALGIPSHLVGDAQLPLYLRHAIASGYRVGATV